MSGMMTQEEAMNMSNEQAIQIVIPMRNMMYDQNGCPISDAVFALDKAIKALSTDRLQEWIPCSEKLPNKSGEYLVTIIQNESSFQQGITNVFIRSLAPANILYGKGFGEQMAWRQELWEDVVAWMPLPKPWKGANDE